MSKLYTANVNNTYDFGISTQQISEFDSVRTSKSKFHILFNKSSYKAEILESDFNRKYYKVIVNNNSYNILINNELDLLIKSLGFEVGALKMINEIKAPMPGLILEIKVKVGQEVKENEALLVLEAMKMENVITAPRDGIIKSVMINKGDAVDKNQLLIGFE